MASLEKIMNLEEETDNPDSVKKETESGSRSSLFPNSTPSTSSYVSSTAPSFAPSSASSQGRRQSPASHTPHPLAAEITSSPPGASSTENRRRSITSTDPMDSPYYSQVHGYAHGHPGSSSRPYTTSSPGGDGPVKLTPITGRVSRAKKGVPVHVCELCRPPKTFTRAEHLRRHQLSHQPPELSCSVPGCDKVFHRRDLLERHQLRHEQEGKAQGELAPGSSSNSSGGSGTPYVAVSSGTQEFQLPSSGLGGPVGGPGIGLGMAGTDVGMGSTPWPSMADNHNFSGNPMPPSHGDIPGNYRMETVYTGSSSTGLANASCLPPAPSPPWQGSSGVSSTSTGTTSSSDWGRPVSSFPMVQRGVQSPIMDSAGFYPYATSPPQPSSASAYDSTMRLPLAGYPDDGSIQPQGHLLSTVRSLSPTLAVAQSSETLVTMPSAISSSRVTNHLDCSHQPAETLGLLAAAAAPAAPAATVASLSSDARSAIPVYLNVFWDKVDPIYPVIHKSTFEKTSGVAPEHAELLQCAMAAIATQFLEDKNHRVNGNELHAYAWHASKIFTQSEPWPVPIMQTVALCEYYARFRGRRKESHRPSSRFSMLYQMVLDQVTSFASIPNTGDSLSSWRQWIDWETCRRLLASCFVLDVHSTIYYEQPPVVILNLDYSSLSTLPIPLSSSTMQLWDAPDHQAWSNLLITAGPVKTVGTVSSKPLTAVGIRSVPPFDAAILLAASALRLPKRHDPTNVDFMEETSAAGSVISLANSFPYSSISNTYLALHYTPLHVLLSVSGDSWVFNKKVLRSTMFSDHRQYLDGWRKSSKAAAAVCFAARALRAFFGLTPDMDTDNDELMIERERGVPWSDISDYWGVYVCALICWAYGHGYRGEHGMGDASRRTARHWIVTASRLEPGHLREWGESRDTLAVVCLVRDILSKDCVGGRNILFADSVGVLRKLGGSDRWDWP